jgi:hypothetical protein
MDIWDISSALTDNGLSLTCYERDFSGAVFDNNEKFHMSNDVIFTLYDNHRYKISCENEEEINKIREILLKVYKKEFEDLTEVKCC